MYLWRSWCVCVLLWCIAGWVCTNSVNCMDWTESGTPLALKCSKLVGEASEYFIQPIEEHFP